MKLNMKLYLSAIQTHKGELLIPFQEKTITLSFKILLLIWVVLVLKSNIVNILVL